MYPWVAPTYNIKVIDVDVPAVLVPDSFAWTVAPFLTGDQGRISTHVGAPARVGQTGLGWDRSLFGGPMRRNPIQFVMSAQIIAIPEPATATLATFGSLCFVVSRIRAARVNARPT
jgi:hypothetical protein